MNQPADGTMVLVHGAVVVGHVTNKTAGDIWVQDQGGGTYSGIHLTCTYGGSQPDCSMTQGQVDALAVGAIVDVAGTFSSALPAGAPSGAKAQLVINAPTLNATGSTLAPVPVSAPIEAVAKDQYAAATTVPYEGCYVHVGGLNLSVSNLMATEFEATCTSSGGVPGTTYTGFEVTAPGGSPTLAIGLTFDNTVTYCLPMCGYPCSNPVATQVFTSVQGILEPSYNANGAIYLGVSPVQDSDIPHQ
jgi:hypothetical protein